MSTAQLAAVIAEAQRQPDDAAVIATNARGTIVFWNDRAESLYGWRADEVIGRDIVDVTPTPGTADEAAQIMEELAQGREWRGRFIVRRCDGTPVLVSVVDVPVLDAAGKVIGVVGVSRRDGRITPPTNRSVG